MKLRHLHDNYDLRPDILYQRRMRRLNIGHLRLLKQTAWLSPQFTGNTTAPYLDAFA